MNYDLQHEPQQLKNSQEKPLLISIIQRFGIHF
jgi:hypothetical protein